MIIPLGPRPEGLEQLQVALGVAGGVEELAEDVVADGAVEEEGGGPDEVGVAGGGAGEEGPGGVLGQQGRGGAEVRRGGGERGVAALLARHLRERHAEERIARLGEVRPAGPADQPLQHERDVDAPQRRLGARQRGYHPPHVRRVQVQARRREGPLQRLRDLERVHDVLPAGQDDRRDGVLFQPRQAGHAGVSKNGTKWQHSGVPARA